MGGDRATLPDRRAIIIENPILCQTKRRGGAPGSSKPGAQHCHRHCRLVSRHSDYDGLVQAENGQLLRRDAQLDAASDAGLLVDQAQLVERLEHLVD